MGEGGGDGEGGVGSRGGRMPCFRRASLLFRGVGSSNERLAEMDLQFGIFVGVDRHDESKLESRGFCIGFQSHRRTQSQRYLTQSAALKQGSTPRIRPCCIPYQLLRDVPKHTIATAYYCRTKYRQQINVRIGEEILPDALTRYKLLYHSVKL